MEDREEWEDGSGGGTQIDGASDDGSGMDSNNDRTITEVDEDEQQDLSGFSQTQLVSGDTALELDEEPLRENLPAEAAAAAGKQEGREGDTPAMTRALKPSDPHVAAIADEADFRSPDDPGKSGGRDGGGRGGGSGGSAADAASQPSPLLVRLMEVAENTSGATRQRPIIRVAPSALAAIGASNARPGMRAELNNGISDAAAAVAAGRDLLQETIDLARAGGEGSEQAAAAPLEGETQPTQVDSPEATSAPDSGSPEQRVPSTDDGRRPSPARDDGTRGARSAGQAPEDLDSESPSRVSRRRRASLSPRSQRSVAVAERRPRSPLRRTGQGSGVFLALGASAPASGKATPPGGNSDMPASSTTASTLSAIPASHRPGGNPLEQTGDARDGTPSTGGDLTPASRGTTTGFLSSAEPSAKASGGGVSRTLSSPQSLPRGWLHEQITAAATAAGVAAAPVVVSRRAGVRGGVGERGQNWKGKGRPVAGETGAARKKDGAVRTAAAAAAAAAAEGSRQEPKRPSPAKVVPGPGRWIQMKSSASKGGSASAVAGGGGRSGREHAAAPDHGHDIDDSETQDASVSQNILAIGVPQERRVRGPPPPPQLPLNPSPADAAADTAGTAQSVREDGESQSGEEEEEEWLGTPAGIPAALNTQDINPDDFSQIRKDCSQGRKEVDRLLEQALAGVSGVEGEGGGGGGGGGKYPSSQPDPHPLDQREVENGASSGRQEGSPPDGLRSQAPDGGSGGRGHASVSGKRKKMRASVPTVERGKRKVPGGGGGGGGRGGGAGGVARSRTPGAYVGGSGSKSSAKKRPFSSPPLNGAARPTKNVFDLPSDEEGDSDATGAGGAARLTTPCAKAGSGARPAAKSGVSRDKGKGKKSGGRSPARVRAATRSANSYGVTTRGGGKNMTVSLEADASDDPENGRSADFRDWEDSQVERTEQELQMEKAMAAIRKEHTPGSSLPDRDEDGSCDEEQEGELGRDFAAQGAPTDVGRPSMAAPPGGQSGGGAGGARGGGGRKATSPHGERPFKTQAKQTAPAPDAAEEGGSSGGGGGGGGGASEAVLEREGRRRGAAASTAAADAEPVTYCNLAPFLMGEGWECVNGKGLHTWFYIFPGSKKGRDGKRGVDFLVSEEDMVEHVCRNEEFLERFRAYRRNLAKSPDGGNDLVGGSAAGVEAPRRGRGNRGGRGARGARGGRGGRGGGGVPALGRSAGGKRAGGSDSGSGSAVEQEGNDEPGEKHVENHAGRLRNSALITDLALAAAGQERQASPDGPDWLRQYRECWPDLKQDGWCWMKGIGLASYVWLKPGVSKNNGRLGVDMFHSEQEVVAHVLGLSAPVRADEGEVDAGDWEPFDIVEGKPRLREWGLTRDKPKRVRVRPSFPGDTPPPAEIAERADEPKRKADRKIAQLLGPPAAAVQPSAPVASTGGSSANLGDEGVASRTQKKKPRHPRKHPQTNALSPPAKRGRMTRDAPSSRQLCDGAGAGEEEQGGSIECEDDAESPEDTEAATQPQFELSLAINMARVGQGRRKSSRAAAVALEAGDEGATPAPAAAPAAAPEPEGVTGTPAADRGEVGTPEDVRKTAAASLTRASPTSPSERPPEERSRQQEIPAAPAVGGSGAGAASPTSASGAPDSSRGSRKRGGSPSEGDTPRASSRKRGPLSGLGVAVTGIRGEEGALSRESIEEKVKKMGGKVVQLFDKKGVCDSDWVKWLLREASNGGSGGDDAGPLRSEGGRRMVLVAAPDSDRTPKFQLALAARVPIVHQSYITACLRIAHEVDPGPYLLPFGRSALGDQGLVMPHTPTCSGGERGGGGGGGGGDGADDGDATGRVSTPPKEKPFQGKDVLLHMGDDKLTIDRWAYTMRAAGATVTVVDESIGSARGGGRKAGRGAAAASGGGFSRCTLSAAIDLLKKGQMSCVIGPNDCPTETSKALDSAAQTSGTAAGTLEWASQCMIHGRQLVPNAGTCPWFPLGAAGGGGGGVREAHRRRGRFGGRGGKGKGRAGRGGGGRGAATNDGSTTFYVHFSPNSRRYVAGDYVLLKADKGETGAGATAPAGAAVGAARRPRVAHLVSFEKSQRGEISARVTVMQRSAGDSKELVAGAQELVPEGVLGRRVLVMSLPQMEMTQMYSVKDDGILYVADQGSE